MVSFFVKNSNILTLVGFFIVFLLYFVFGTEWYEPARLIIKGQAENTNTFVDVQWDSGAGFNAYEQEQFQFLPSRGGGIKEHLILLKGGQSKNPASKNSRIVLSEIRIDDKGLSIPQSSLEAVRHVPRIGWLFESAGSKISLKVSAKERVYFLLNANARAGIAHISINGHETSHDLYRGNWAIPMAKLNFWFLDEKGNFSVSFAMPRYEVDLLQIKVPPGVSLSSVYLQTKNGRTVDLALSADSDSGRFQFVAPTLHLKQYVHANRILFQIVFAFLAAWGAYSLLLTVARYGGVWRFFFGAQLRIFWLFFLGAVLTYGVWLLAFWPGVMSVDSLNIWRAAWLPDVMINDHPAVNVLWYMFLLHLWNNSAVVPLSQILLLAFLIASTFFYCYRQGISLLLLLPCYCLLLLAMPVGLYSVTLWKDIPFALLVVFWSLALPYFYLQKSEENRFRFTLQQKTILLLLFLALILFRHNGLVYLFAIPLIFFALRFVRLSFTTIASCVLVVACITLLVIFPPKSLKSASYFHDLSNSYLQQLTKESAVSRVKQSIGQYPRLLDLKKNKTQSDLWHYFLGDRYAYTFLKQSEWSDSHKYISRDTHPFPQLRDSALMLYEKSYEYPWVYLSWNPFLLLYLFPLSILLCRWFPLSAIFSSVVLIQVLALLLFVGTVNWRYYYFVLLGGYFLLPLLLLDWHRLTHSKAIDN